VAAGELIDIPPRLLVYAFIGMCNWLYRWYKPDGPFTQDMIVETFTHILESGSLRPRAGSRALPVSDQLQRLQTQVSEMKEELKKVSRRLRPAGKR